MHAEVAGAGVAAWCSGGAPRWPGRGRCFGRPEAKPTRGRRMPFMPKGPDAELDSAVVLRRGNPRWGCFGRRCRRLRRC